jgi:DNA repair photolyase
MRKSYTPEVIAISGVTDPYQPVERRLRLTRRCLEVLAEFRNPVTVITKNHLVTRDIDVLADSRRNDAAAVALSITTLDEKLQRVMEPRTSIPAAPGRRGEAGHRGRARRRDGRAHRARHHGPRDARDPEAPPATPAPSWAGYVMLRLPHAVAPLFEDWLTHHFPERKQKVLNRVRGMRGGKLYDSAWGERARGTGEFADQIGALFRAARKRRLHARTPRRTLHRGVPPARPDRPARI